jgi:hypothetical protein
LATNRESAARYRATHLEQERERKRIWTKANRERLNAKNHEWYLKNIESERARAKIVNRARAADKLAWAQKNRARVNAKAREWYAKNIESTSARKRIRSETHRLKRNARGKARYRERHEEYLQKHAEYREQNRERVRERGRRWMKENRAYGRALCAKWNAAKYNACPKWADMDAILAIYQEAHRITRATGIQYDVDHIVPLQGNGVCGLHVPWNLQILTRSENARKSNRL